MVRRVQDNIGKKGLRYKGIMLVVTMTLGGVLSATQLSAKSFQGLGMRRHARGEMPSVDDQIKRMTKQLSLTEDQQQKLKPILEDQRHQMQQLGNDSSLSKDEKFGKMRDVHENASSQIKAFLNEAQRKKFDELQQKRRERWQTRQGSGSDKE